MTGLTSEQAESIKQSYLNIVAFLVKGDRVEGRYLICLLKWALELGLDPADLGRGGSAHSNLLDQSEKVQKVEAMFHLVHMICLDAVVEDVELEIASIYAQKLGFHGSLVSELVKSIVTADSDGTPVGDVRQQVIDFMALNGETI